MGRSARKPGSNTAYGGRVYDTTERRADYAIEQRAKKPLASYAEMLELVRKEFGCGITAAEQALARARERMAEQRNNTDGQAADMVQSIYGAVAAKALEQGNLTEARKAGEALAKLFGINGAEKVELVRKPDAPGELEDLTDEEIEIAARMDRAKSH